MRLETLRNGVTVKSGNVGAYYALQVSDGKRFRTTVQNATEDGRYDPFADETTIAKPMYQAIAEVKAADVRAGREVMA